MPYKPLFLSVGSFSLAGSGNGGFDSMPPSYSSCPIIAHPYKIKYREEVR